MAEALWPPPWAECLGRPVAQKYQFRQRLQSKYLSSMADSLVGAQKLDLSGLRGRLLMPAHRWNHPGWQQSVLSAQRLEKGGHQVGPGIFLSRQSKKLDLQESNTAGWSRLLYKLGCWMPPVVQCLPVSLPAQSEVGGWYTDMNVLPALSLCQACCTIAVAQTLHPGRE